MTTKPDRHSLENQRAAAHTNLKSAKVEHSHACLLAAQNPKNTEAAALVEQLEEEILIHERTIARLEAAKLARTDEETEEAKAERRAVVQKATNVAKGRDVEIARIAEKIAHQLQVIAPLTAQLEAAQRERDSAVVEGLRAGFGRAKDRPDPAVLLADHAVKSALRSALLDSGLPRGPLADTITLRLPEHFSVEQMHQARAKHTARIADALQRALAAVDRKEGAA